MRLLHIGKRYPPDRGGIESVLEALCRGHAAQGHDVTALVSHEQPWTSDERREGVRVVRLGTSLRVGPQDVTIGLPAAIARHRGDVNVVHLPNPWATAAAQAADAVGRRRGRPPWVAFWHAEITKQRLANSIYRPVLHRFLRRAERIVVTSARTIDLSPVLRALRERCVVIPLGVDAARYDASRVSPERVRELQAALGDHVLFIGRAVHYKGLDVLIDAWRRVPRPLVVVGTGPLLRETRERARLAGVLPRVHFVGDVSDADLLAHLHACAVLALPSTGVGEAFGLVQVEAMACGKPVVSTDLPTGVPWVNQDGVTGLVVPPGDPRSLADALVRLLEDPALRDRLGLAGRARAVGDLSVARMVDAHGALYRDLSR